MLILTFVIVWAVLLAATLILLPNWADVSLFQRSELALVTSLFAAFVLELGWAFIREICTTGSRGLLEARLFVLVVVVAAVLLGGMSWLGWYSETRGHLFAALFTPAAILYVRSRLDQHGTNRSD